MRNMHNLVKYCVPLIGGSISRPLHDVANPDLVGRYNMTQNVTSTYGCYENYCNHGKRTSYQYLMVQSCSCILPHNRYLSYFKAYRAKIWYEDASSPNSQFR